jgi:hypothetical protein
MYTHMIIYVILSLYLISVVTTSGLIKPKAAADSRIANLSGNRTRGYFYNHYKLLNYF